jgi:hypothetical protein
MTNRSTYRRYAPGLYVDPTERYVISRDGYNYWTVRDLIGYGFCLDGKTVMPDYSDIVYCNYSTFAECKQRIAEWK